jgi:hypothetical protein
MWPRLHGLAVMRRPHALDIQTGRHARDCRRAARRSDPARRAGQSERLASLRGDLRIRRMLCSNPKIARMVASITLAPPAVTRHLAQCGRLGIVGPG